MFSYVLLPYFVYDHIYLLFITPYEVCESLLVSLPVTVVLSICLPLLVGPFNSTEKSDCHRINLALSVISVPLCL